MLHMDRGADVNLAFFRIGLQGVKAGGLHQADHVGRGIDGRQLAVVSRERVLELDDFFDFGVRAGRERGGTWEALYRRWLL